MRSPSSNAIMDLLIDLGQTGILFRILGPLLELRSKFHHIWDLTTFRKFIDHRLMFDKGVSVKVIHCMLR